MSGERNRHSEEGRGGGREGGREGGGKREQPYLCLLVG